MKNVWALCKNMSFLPREGAISDCFQPFPLGHLWTFKKKGVARKCLLRKQGGPENPKARRHTANHFFLHVGKSTVSSCFDPEEMEEVINSSERVFDAIWTYGKLLWITHCIGPHVHPWIDWSLPSNRYELTGLTEIKGFDLLWVVLYTPNPLVDHYFFLVINWRYLRLLLDKPVGTASITYGEWSHANLQSNWKRLRCVSHMTKLPRFCANYALHEHWCEHWWCLVSFQRPGATATKANNLTTLKHIYKY